MEILLSKHAHLFPIIVSECLFLTLFPFVRLLALSHRGSVREPFLKIVHLMRALEYEPSSRSPFLRLGKNLQDAIGQEAHKLPSVFSFFKPEYAPAGKIASAGLVSPEAQGTSKLVLLLYFSEI